MTVLRWNSVGAKLALLDRSTAGRLPARLPPRKFAKISQRRAHGKISGTVWMRTLRRDPQLLRRRDIRHSRNDRLALIRIDTGRVARASIIFPIEVAPRFTTVEGLFFPLWGSGHMHWLWIFAHGIPPVAASCPLSVGHTVNFGCGLPGASVKASTAPSTSIAVTSGAAA
jgi:hypothetical protein